MGAVTTAHQGAVKAAARLVAEQDPDGRTVLRELRSMAPLTLFPKRRAGESAVVHLVSSASAPLGGDDLRLDVVVGPGARLRLSGVNATLALPGSRAEGSTSTVNIKVESGGSIEYLPEPTIVTQRARHVAALTAELDAGARIRAREVLVLGRTGERPGRLATSLHVTHLGGPVLRQDLHIGEPALDASTAYLAGRTVLATELRCGEPGTPAPASGDWWSRTPLAAGGAIATALAHDVITAERSLATAWET